MEPVKWIIIFLCGCGVVSMDSGQTYDTGAPSSDVSFTDASISPEATAEPQGDDAGDEGGSNCVIRPGFKEQEPSGKRFRPGKRVVGPAVIFYTTGLSKDRLIADKEDPVIVEEDAVFAVPAEVEYFMVGYLYDFETGCDPQREWELWIDPNRSTQ